MMERVFWPIEERRHPRLGYIWYRRRERRIAWGTILIGAAMSGVLWWVFL